MFRSCVNNHENACLLDGDSCDADCPLFENITDQGPFIQDIARFWDYMSLTTHSHLPVSNETPLNGNRDTGD
jgi:hypothetical protein